MQTEIILVANIIGMSSSTAKLMTEDVRAAAEKQTQDWESFYHHTGNSFLNYTLPEIFLHGLLCSNIKSGRHHNSPTYIALEISLPI